MNRLRVVLDTNVIVSAALNPHGLEARVIELVASRRLSLFLSASILAEYEAVLARPKFARIERRHLTTLLRLLKAEATMVVPKATVSASRDKPDNRFLECAEEAAATFLITGNKRHFPSGWKSTRIVNAREFFDAIRRDAHS